MMNVIFSSTTTFVNRTKRQVFNEIKYSARLPYNAIQCSTAQGSFESCSPSTSGVAQQLDKGISYPLPTRLRAYTAILLTLHAHITRLASPSNATRVIEIETGIIDEYVCVRTCRFWICARIGS